MQQFLKVVNHHMVNPDMDNHHMDNNLNQDMDNHHMVNNPNQDMDNPLLNLDMDNLQLNQDMDLNLDMDKVHNLFINKSLLERELIWMNLILLLNAANKLIWVELLL